MAALCCVPLVKGGRVVAGLTVHDSGPRHWTDEEISLIEEVAERTWSAIERARAEQQLHEANRQLEEQFRTLVDGVGQTVWATDAEGRVVDDSPSWRAFTGQTVDERLSWGWVDAVHPEDRAYAARQWADAVDAGTRIDTRFRLHHAPSDSYHLTRVRAIPLRYPDGTIHSWLGMNTDLDD
jgi:PAS domain S-box-containing protein